VTSHDLTGWDVVDYGDIDRQPFWVAHIPGGIHLNGTRFDAVVTLIDPVGIQHQVKLFQDPERPDWFVIRSALGFPLSGRLTMVYLSARARVSSVRPAVLSGV
jgi:hypothetical protein